MKIIRDYKNCPEFARKTIIALGNFDGLHLGHKAVINKTIEIAKNNSLPSAVMTFEPHPVQIFRPDTPPLRITPFRRKVHLVKELGIDFLFPVRFNNSFAKITATDFIEKILVKYLGVQHVVIGYDFIFGHKRSGNALLLKKFSKKHGFGLTQLKAERPEDKNSKDVFSSTIIRNLLKEGKINEAREMLGHDFIIEGRVIKGDDRGKNLGFHTANIKLKDYLRPAFGVYIAEVQTFDGKWHQAILNIGNRPTFKKTDELLEVHIFDMNENLYGQKLCVKFLKYIRPEIKFANPEELKKQIAEDIKKTKDYFNNITQPSVI